MKTQAVILVALFACGWASADRENLVETVQDCGDGSPLPSEVYVEGCDEYPCVVYAGGTVYFTLVFNAPRDSETLKAVPNLSLGTLDIPVGLEDSDACKGILGGCPLKENETYEYSLGMAVAAPVTGVTVDLKFYLEDSSGDKATCYKYRQFISG